MRVLCAVVLVAVYLGLASVAEAVTRYVDGNLAATCVGSTYSIASRNCSGSDGTGYKTVAEGLAALVASDVLKIRAGTYVVSSIYGDTAAETWGCTSGCPTSWATATTINNYPGEAVVVQSRVMRMDNLTSTGGVAYVIIQGDSRANFIWEHTGATEAEPGFLFHNNVRHVRLQTLIVRNFTLNGLSGTEGSETQRKSDLQFIDLEITNNGTATQPGGQEHGIYIRNVDDILIEDCWIHDNYNYQIHLYHTVANAIMRAIVRNNFVEGSVSGASGGILVATGSGHKIHNNVVNGKGEQTNGIQLNSAPNGTEIYNNTTYNTTSRGLRMNNAVNTKVRNNIFASTPDPVDPGTATGTTISNNWCHVADGSGGCVGTGAPGFVSPGTNFALASGSGAINAGSTATGLPYNGSAPDIGAFGTFVFASCVVEDGDASTLRVTFENNAAPPLLPASSVTGVTSRKAGANNPITASTRTGDNRLDFTLTNAIVNGDAVDMSASGTNITDSALIGNTAKQPYVQTLTNQSCTNNVGAAASHVFTQAAFEFHGLRGTEDAPIGTPYATAPENTNIQVMVGGSVRLRFALTCTTTACPATGFYPFYSCAACGTSGTYTQVPDTFVANEDIGFCGTGPDPDIPTNGTATTDQLSTSGTFVPGAFVRTSTAIPTLTIPQNQKTELEYCFSFSSSATATRIYSIRLYRQDATEINAYTVTPTITIAPVSAGMGF